MSESNNTIEKKQEQINTDNNTTNTSTDENNNLASILANITQKEEGLKEKGNQESQEKEHENITNLGDLGDDTNNVSFTPASTITQNNNQQNNISQTIAPQQQLQAPPQTPQNQHIYPTMNNNSTMRPQLITEDTTNNQEFNNIKQHQQNTIQNSYDPVGSNVYDLHRDFFKIQNDFNDAMVVKGIRDDINAEIKKDDNLLKLEKKNEDDRKEAKDIKNWKNGWSSNFASVISELLKKIDNKDRISIGDLEDWKKDYLIPLKEEIKNNIDNAKNNILKSFFKKMLASINYIDDKYHNPFDEDQFNLDLTAVHGVISKRLADINDSIIKQIIVIIYDFFTGRKTFTEIEDAKQQINSLRDDIENFSNSSKTKGKEAAMTMINEKILKILSVCKSQHLSIKELNKLKQTLSKTLISDTNGMEIVHSLIIEFGQDIIKTSYQSLDKKKQNNIENAIYKHYINKYTKNAKDVKAIVKDMLNGGKMDKVEEKYSSDEQRKIVKNIFKGTVFEEHKAIETEYNDMMSKADLVTEGLQDLNDIDEVEKRTKMITDGINKLRQNYEAKLKSDAKKVENAQILGTPIPSIPLAFIKGAKETFKNTIELLLVNYKSFYGDCDSMNKVEKKRKLKEEEEKFNKQNKKFKAKLNSLETKEKDKETDDEIIKPKIGKQSDYSLFKTFLEREEITKLKFKSWESIKEAENEAIKGIDAIISGINMSSSNNRNAISIMNFAKNNEKIKNSVYSELISKGMINSSKQRGDDKKFL